MTDDGWIVHDGKDCPVSLASKPGVRFRDGKEIEAGVHSAGDWIQYENLWLFACPGGADIIAYRPESGGAL